MKLNEIYGRGDEYSRHYGFPDEERWMPDELYIELYDPQTDEDAEATVEAEVDWDKSDPKVGYVGSGVDQINALILKDDLTFKGKTYKRGQEFPHELIPYVYPVQEKVKEYYDRLAQRVVQQLNAPPEAAKSLAQIHATSGGDPNTIGLKTAVWAQKFLGTTDPQILQRLKFRDPGDLEGIFYDIIEQDIESQQ